MQVKTVDIGKLRPCPWNPKKHPDRQIDLLVRSLKEYGFDKPILVTKDNMIVAGHGIVVAAKKAGMTSVPVVYSPLIDKKALARMVMDNKSAELAEDDFGKMTDLMTELDNGEFDLELTGWDMSEIEEIMNWTPTEEQEDAFNSDDAVKKIGIPESKPGDIYKLGRHRLMCGDATNRSCIDKLLDGRTLDMIFTDPPYNVAYKGTKYDKILGDDQTEEEFVEFSCNFMGRMAEALKPGGVFYICSGFSSCPIFLYAIKKTGMVFSTPIIWVKNNTSLGWGDYRHKHEMVLKGKVSRKPKGIPILYGWNGGKHYFKDTRFEADVWHVKRRAGTTMVHPTQKPLALIVKALRNSSRKGEAIGDFFGGSGGTLIVCERENRNCYIMELDPIYCEVSIKRWENYTGKKAELVQ